MSALIIIQFHAGVLMLGARFFVKQILIGRIQVGFNAEILAGAHPEKKIGHE